MSKIESFIIILFLLHIFLSICKYFKHRTFNLATYLIAIDRPIKFVLFCAFLGYSFATIFILRSYSTEVYYDVSGNYYILKFNKFYLYDSKDEYTIKDDTLYIGNIKVAYLKDDGVSEKTIYNLKNERKLSIVRPSKSHGVNELPIISTIFKSNAQILFDIQKKNAFRAIKRIEANNIKINEQIQSLNNKRDSIIKIYESNVDIQKKNISKNNIIINILENKLK